MVHLHRGKGVPLEGPFLGCFSQGNLTKVNEIVLFHRFRIFCYLDPASLGNSSLLRLGILTSFHLAIPTYFVGLF